METNTIKVHVADALSKYTGKPEHLSTYFKFKYPDIFQSINSLYSWLDDKYTFMHKLYWISNDIFQFPKCVVCGGDVKKVATHPDGYIHVTCSLSCSRKLDDVKLRTLKTIRERYTVQEIEDRKKRTNLAKFGCDNASKNEDIKKKISVALKKAISLHGPEIMAKHKKTMMGTYGVENATQCPVIQDRIKKTNMLRYGGHPMRCQTVKSKLINTMMSRYGTSVTMNIQEAAQKYSQTCMDRYGVTQYLQSEDSRKIYDKWRTEIYNKDVIGNPYSIPNFPLEDFIKCGWNDKHQVKSIYSWTCRLCGNVFDAPGIAKCPKCYTKGRSVEEIEIFEFVKTLVGENEQVIKSDRSIVSPKELDIYIPSRKIAIEYDGLYWHSDNILQDDCKKYHLSKTTICNDKGIQLIHIFEDEWICKKEIVKSRLRSLFGVHDNVVYARKCTIKDVPHKECVSFLNENHIQGNVNSKYRIGLYYNEQLVSIMTFGNYRKSMGSVSKENEYELLRFCCKLNYHIPGAASKLFKYFIRTYNPKRIKSYADRRWSLGKLYYQLGFTLRNVSEPNYWYIRYGDAARLYRYNFRKSNLKNVLQFFDENISERDNMRNNGYSVIYDCGNYSFTYEADDNSNQKD